jgi:hypothetical protein
LETTHQIPSLKKSPKFRKQRSQKFLRLRRRVERLVALRSMDLVVGFGMELQSVQRVDFAKRI